MQTLSWDPLIASSVESTRQAWRKPQIRKFKSEAARAEARDKFFEIWTTKEYLCKRVGDSIQWKRFTFDPGGR
jgi:phosphopantetheinyl transferase